MSRVSETCIIGPAASGKTTKLLMVALGYASIANTWSLVVLPSHPMLRNTTAILARLNIPHMDRLLFTTISLLESSLCSREVHLFVDEYDMLTDEQIQRIYANIANIKSITYTMQANRDLK